MAQKSNISKIKYPSFIYGIFYLGVLLNPDPWSGQFLSGVELCCIARIQLYVYIYIYAETYSTIMTNEPTSLEKYTSRKGGERVVCERWVGDGIDFNILTPSSSDYSSTSFSFCWAAHPGVTEVPSLLPRTATRTPTATDSNKLKPFVAPSYIIVWRPPAFCGRRNCTKFNPSTGQGDTPISSTGCTCFLIDG